MSELNPAVDDNTQTLYCANHPDRETTLRCNRCEKPICIKCAVSTPTGYRCQECVRGQQKIFDTAQTQDYLFAVLVAGILSAIGSVIASYLGFFALLIAPVSGVITAEAVRAAVRRRRSKKLFLAAAGAAALGSFPQLFLVLLSFNLWGIAIQAFYTFAVSTTVYQALKGINLR